MKRAVLKNSNIEKCIQNRVFATPFPKDKLFFNNGEKVYVALRIEDAKRLKIKGEYNYIFVFEDYLGEDEKQAKRLYGEAKWKHFWLIKEINRIKPFSLKEDLVIGTSRNKKEFYDYYRGQELAYKVVIDILPEDKELFESYTEILDSDIADTLEEDIFNKKVESIKEDLKIKKIKRVDNLKQIRKISAKNLRTKKNKIKSYVYARNSELSARLKMLYKDKCQICGSTFVIPGTERYYSENHHIVPLGKKGNDIDKNIIIVCPTCHKKFDRKYYILDVDKKKFKSFNEQTSEYVNGKLSLDRHLFIN